MSVDACRYVSVKVFKLWSFSIAVTSPVIFSGANFRSSIIDTVSTGSNLFNIKIDEYWCKPLPKTTKKRAKFKTMMFIWAKGYSVASTWEVTTKLELKKV